MGSSLHEAQTPVAGARRYRVEDELARGGMGVVYRAWDRARHRSVALKRALSDSQDAAARTRSSELLEREYRTLIALKHPRIIEVYDYGHDADGPYYTMELLDGFDLRARCPLPWREACSMLRDVASSLALLHARRLLHRDVSPANIRVSAQGAKLFDFGTLVPFGCPDHIAGTPACVPPEVLDGAELDQRVDLYALGATAYYALSGRLAYQARSFAQLRAVWAQHLPARPSTLAADIPPALDELVMSLLSLDPLSRPASAGEVIDRLSAIAELPRDEDERVVQSYLRNPNLVGREEASTRLLSHLGRALSGAGSTVLVEGAVGHGKSVMLSGLEREALIRGAVVLSVNGRARNEPLGAVRMLAQQAALACASEATEEAGETLGRASSSPQANAAEPSEHELDELVEQFVAWADVRPLVLLVDDAHVADAHSLSVLSTLAKRAPRLRLLVALSADLDRAHDQVGLRAIRRGAARIHLGPLSSDDLELLVRAVFGVVPGLKRLSAFLSLETSGNPMLCMDLLSELIEQHTIRYAEGFWVLPQSFAPRETVAAQAAFGRRLLRVSESARALASCLSTRRTPSNLTFCGLLAQRELGLTIDQVEPLLDELIKERVLVSDGGQHAFAHRELQTMLYDQLDPDRRARLHRVMTGELMALPVATLRARSKSPATSSSRATKRKRTGIDSRL